MIDVSNDFLFNIHLKLVEIFGCQVNKPFIRLRVITFGDFFQLATILVRSVYMHYGDTWKNFEPRWRQFETVELTEVMWQKGNNQLIKMLNNVRIAKLAPKLGDGDTATLKLKFIDPSIANLQSDTLHNFAENTPADTHNLAKLEALDSPLHNIPSIDLIPKHVSSQKIEEVLNLNQSNTSGLAQLLNIKLNARVILTLNIDVKHRLVNGQLGTVMHIARNHRNEIFKIYVQFDDNEEGLMKLNTGIFVKQHFWVPIDKTELKIKVKLNKDTSRVIQRT